MADTSASGGNIVTGSGVASSRTALNLSLFKSGTLVKFIIGLVVSIFAVAATTTTVMVVVIRSDPRYPVAVSDALLTYKNVPAPINPVTNDLVEEGKFSSGDQNALEVIAVGQPANGIAKLIDGAKNQIQYTPNPGFIGEDQFTYTVKNSKFSSVGLINVTVLNHVPEPANDEATASKNKEKEIFVLENDIDVDNDTLVVVGVGELSIPDVGTVRFTNRSVIFAPAPQVVRKVSFSYLVFDGNNTANASVTITVLNDPPVAAPDSGFAYINTVSRINVLANDADINGDRLSILYADGAENGVLDYTSDPSIITYTPLWGFMGADRFEYIITDGFEDPESGQMTSDRTTVEIEIVNRPPKADDVTVNVPKNSDFVELLTDDMWGDLDTYSTLEMRILNNASLGETNFTKTSQVNEVLWIDTYQTYVTNDYSLLYKPKYRALGVDHLNYSVSDGMATTQGKITINIINTPPVARPDHIEVDRNLPFSFNPVLNDYDPNGDEIYFVSVTNGSHGSTRSPDNINVYYQPNRLYLGRDEFTYVISDVSGEESKTATGTVTVNVINTPPVAYNDIYYVHKSLPTTINVTENDYDKNDDPLNIIDIENVEGPSANKTVLAATDNRDAILYIPLPGLEYTETFTYTIWDNDLATINSTATVTVIVRNDPPVAKNDEYEVIWRHSITIQPTENDYDKNPGDVLTVASFTQPSHGTVTRVGPGSLKYTPTGMFVGDDSFTYVAIDESNATSASANVTIHVTNRAPTAVADSYRLLWGARPYVLNVTANDTDADGDQIYLEETFQGVPSNKGALEYDGTNQVFIYTPGSFIGNTGFLYTITDENMNGEAAVSIEVYDNAPVPSADRFSFHWRTYSNGFSLNVLANDNDPDAEDVLRVTAVTQASKGRAAIKADSSSIIYTPSGPFKGTDSFTYTVSDGLLEVDDVPVTVEITNANLPQCRDDTYSLHWRTTTDTIFEVIANDQDADGDTLWVKTVTPGSLGGTVSIVSGPNPRSIMYRPNTLGRVGVDNVVYQCTDTIDVGSATARITITNDNPVAVADTLPAFHWREVKTINVLDNDSDPNGDPISLVGIVQSPLYGSASKSGNSIVYSVTQMGASSFSTAANRYELADSFVYRITDGCTTGFAQNSVNVVAYNRKPVATGKTYPAGTAVKNGPAVILRVLEDDTDPDQQDIPYLTITSTKNTVGCSVSIVNNNKEIRFVPNQGFSGEASFQYAISDGHASSAFVTVIVPIENAPPTCSNLQATVPKSANRAGAYATFSVASNSLNCVDPDGDAVFITSAALAVPDNNKGDLVFDPATSNQYFKFLPKVDRSGQFSIPFTISDGVVTVSFTLTVTVTNNAPVASSDNLGAWLKTATSPRTLSINLLSNDRDPDNDALQVTGINGGGLTATLSGGVVVTSTSNGAVTISWPYYYYGSQSFTYTITDNDRDNPRTASATATFTINGYAPVARDDFASVEWGTTKTIDVLSNDYDQDGDAITLYSVDQPDNGDSAYISGNKIVYTSSGRTCNTARVRYTIRTVDGFASATLTVDIVKCYCLAKIELIFVVDGSGSVGQSNFNNVIKPFLKDVTAGFDLDKRDPSDGSAVGTRAGLIHFSSSAQYETTSWVTSNAAMYNEINQMYYRGGSTNTKAGLQYAVNFFNNNGGARPPQFPPDPNPVVIIILTDGEWNTGGDPKPLAEDINNRPGWRIYAVAVATADYNEIRALAWNPTENVGFFSASNWDALKRQEFVQSIIDQACDNKQAL